MSQHQKLVYGSLFVFFAATHVGCAGSGLKNMFTRNETIGYRSLDELKTEEPKVAADEEVEKPSVPPRPTSWRPFSKAEPPEDETSVARKSHSAHEGSERAGTSPRFLGRALTNRASVEPDPFLSAEPELPDGFESPSSNAVPHQKIAKTHDGSKTPEDGFVDEADPKAAFAKERTTGNRKSHRTSEATDPDTNAVTWAASRRADPGGGSDDQDGMPAKRINQHILQTSGEAVETNETATTTTQDELRKRILSRAESRKRQLASSADRPINQFDLLLAANSDSAGKTSGSFRSADAEPLLSSKRSTSTTKKSRSSLAEFDQLLGTGASDNVRVERDVAEMKTEAPTARKGASVQGVNVADAEALFGDAAARQKSHLSHVESAPRTEVSDHQADGSNVWSQTSEYVEGIETGGSRQGKSESHSDRNRGDIAGVIARHLSGTSVNGKARVHNAAFGLSPTSAGNVADDSNVVRIAAGKQTTTAGDALLTVAPVAPVSPAESDSGVAANSKRPGVVQSFSTRNWLLLIGGAIVIALLFAPGRTKPLPMKSGPARG